ncbi:hypothetical protein ACJJVG_15475 [Pseudocitrobacter faecalis]|uniref:hypothetical protein n=1 Tax=Pseudocitrobacter faecalis TaxID=1398493 RepID=UPI00389A2FE4
MELKAALARLDFAESEAEIYDESLSRICRFVKNVSGLTISFPGSRIWQCVLNSFRGERRVIFLRMPW